MLISLLRIICDGSLNDFLTFRSGALAASVMAENAIDPAVVEHSIKLLSLCSLAATTSSDKILRFEDVQAALQLQDEEGVELLVIEAIGEKLLEASIDQLGKTITVT